MSQNRARGSFRRTSPSVGGRGSPSSVGRHSPSSVDRDSPSNGGRGSPSGGGRGSPSGGGRGSHSGVGRGRPSSGGGGRIGVTGSSTSMDVDMHEDSNEDCRSLDASHEGLSDDVENASSQLPRGSNTMDQVPTDPSNRTVVELLGADFAEPSVTRQIVAIFKNLFRGPWIKWTDVPKSHRDKMWNHFKKLYQWNPEIEAQVEKAWKNVLKERYRDIMGYARAGAIKEAEEADVVVGTNYALLKPFKPIWINQEYWDIMIDKKWNTPQWKSKSKKNKKNKNTLRNGVLAKHTGGSIKMSVIRRKMEKQLGRPPTYAELYTECRTKKASRSNNGTPEFITPTAKEDLEKYLEYMIEKFGPDISTHPLGDLEAWEHAVGGVKKGILKGAPSDPGFVVTGIPSTQIASQMLASRPAPAYVEEVAKLKDRIDSLLEERTQEREASAAREKALIDRMAAIEQMFAKFAPPTTPQ